MYFVIPKKIKRKITFLVACLTILLSGCNYTNPKEKSVNATGFYFDTTVQLLITHKDAEHLKDEVFELCEKMELIFSRTNPDSELYKLNHRSDNRVEVSKELAEAIQLGIEYSEKTKGIFDITICPISDLWDFKSDQPQIPSEKDIENELKKVDYRNVHINGTTVSFDSDDTKIDLGAVAKGYMADQIKDYLTSCGVSSGYINLGGNVQTIGCKSDGTSWNIGIQKPFSDRGTILESVEIEDQSVVSAGIYERYFEYDGVQYYHILDPRTGYPVKTDLDQVTVICDQSVLGDIISTCCILMGENEAKNFIEENDFSNVWLHLGDRCAMIRQ